MSNRIKSAALKILNEDNDLPITLGALSIQEVTPTFPGEIQTQQVIFTLEDDHEIEDECDDYAENVYYIDDPDLPDLPIHPNCKCYYRDADTDEEVDILITVGAAGEGDHWITLDNGVHVLIGAGETMKEALVKHFGGKSKERTPNQVYRNEPIIVSKNAVAEHQKTGSDAAARYGLDKKFATEQARKADELRDKAGPITQKRVNEMTKEFPKAQVSGRIKDRSQMVEKLGRKPDKYKDVSDLKDISGVRVVSGHGIEDVKSIGKEIESKYNVIDKPENYIDNPNAGYRSLHYTIQDKESGVISEVQVRTVNEDKWATFAHDRVYKADGEQRKILDANRGAVNSYLTGMSDYYFKLDSGIKNTKKPDCPPVIHKITGCL